MPARSPQEYDALGRTAILALLEEEHAAGTLELEAKISDTAHRSVGTHVEPIHLNNALRDLRRAGDVVVRTDLTRGARDIPIAHLVGKRNRTAVERAAARKRLLMTRYLGWAQGTPSRKAIIGPAAERTFHRSLVEASKHGYHIVNPDTGTAAAFLGDPVPTGPLDNGAYLLPVDDQGQPGSPVAIPVEVKNVRDWIYPTNPELYQLLEKAALIARAHPSVPVLPLFVCRRAHVTTFRMAKDLGFFIIETRRQYISQAADESKVLELRRELGFLDLVREEGADPVVSRRLSRTLPVQATVMAERWGYTASDEAFVAGFRLMRTLDPRRARARLFKDLRIAAKANALYETEGW